MISQRQKKPHAAVRYWPREEKSVKDTSSVIFIKEIDNTQGLGFCLLRITDNNTFSVILRFPELWHIEHLRRKGRENMDVQRMESLGNQSMGSGLCEPGAWPAFPLDWKLHKGRKFIFIPASPGHKTMPGTQWAFDKYSRIKART